MAGSTFSRSQSQSGLPVSVTNPDCPSLGCLIPLSTSEPHSPYTFLIPTMREVISIHVGQAGVQIGNACCELPLSIRVAPRTDNTQGSCILSNTA